MLALIDESGCPGFKLAKNSSPFFTIGMVIFNDFSEAEKASKIILELKHKLHVKEEFKFSKAHPKVKDAFFGAVCRCDFITRALIVDKKNIYNGYLRENAESFYNFCLKMLIKHDRDMLKAANIKIDGSGNRIFRLALKNYLKHQINKQKIAKLKFVDSKRDNLIQLADMIIGAIARSNDKSKKDSRRWLDILETKGKIDNIWIFG